MLSEKINIREQLQKVGDTVNDYKDSLVATFKDMDVDIKDWTFSVGKVENQYNVEVVVKLAIKPKTI